MFRLIIEYSVISMEETICIIYSSCLIRFPLILRLFHLRGTSTNPHCQSQVNDIKEIKDWSIFWNMLELNFRKEILIFLLLQCKAGENDDILYWHCPELKIKYAFYYSISCFCRQSCSRSVLTFLRLVCFHKNNKILEFLWDLTLGTKSPYSNELDVLGF